MLPAACTSEDVHDLTEVLHRGYQSFIGRISKAIDYARVHALTLPAWKLIGFMMTSFVSRPTFWITNLQPFSRYEAFGNTGVQFSGRATFSARAVSRGNRLNCWNIELLSLCHALRPAHRHFTYIMAIQYIFSGVGGRVQATEYIHDAFTGTGRSHQGNIFILRISRSIPFSTLSSCLPMK